MPSIRVGLLMLASALAAVTLIAPQAYAQEAQESQAAQQQNAGTPDSTAVTPDPNAGTAQAADGNQAAPSGGNAADTTAGDSAEPGSAGDAGAAAGDETAATETGSGETESGESASSAITFPLTTLGIGIVVVLGLIIVYKVNAFIALITAALVVSVLAKWADAGNLEAVISADTVGRVAAAFGKMTGNIGIVIALAAVIGKCLLDSGAADRIVRAFLSVLGEKRAPVALMGSGFVLAVPVFFDTVFYLLVPLARSLHRRTGKQYLKYIMAIAAGGAITHSLVPPTPGPLMMASNLGFDVGLMILIGAAVALPGAVAGLIYSGITDRIMPIPMRAIGSEPEPEPLTDDQLPALWLALLPVMLPVLLIATNTGLTMWADTGRAAQLKVADIQDWDGLTQLLTSDEAEHTAIAQRLQSRLSQPAQDVLAAGTPSSDDDRALVVQDLNTRVLADKLFHDKEAFFGVRINAVAESLVGKDRVRMKKGDAERMNRNLLESAYPDLFGPHDWNTPQRRAANISAFFGNSNFALLLSTVIALWMLVKQRGLSRTEAASVVETSLMSGGVIILITAGGGAFGEMLKAARIGEAIQALFGELNLLESGDSAMIYLSIGFGLATVLKIAQGSGTVAMVVGSSMMAAIVTPEQLGCHPVYLACAIGAGSMVGSWMNDSGFWIFAKMGGLSETEALKSWTLLLVVLGLVSFGVTLAMAQFLPLV